MKKICVMISAVSTLSACSIEVKTVGMIDHAASDRAAAMSTSIATDCKGENGVCLIDAHEKQPAGPPVGNIDEQIHAALRSHPDWLREAVLADPQMIADAQGILAQRQVAARFAQNKKALSDNRAAVFNDSADPVIGNPNGDVTVVEFFDPDCPFCRQLSPILDQLIASDPNVRVVLKDFPILGPGSEVASRYELASIRQGKYAKFHSVLLGSTLPEHEINEEKTLAFAKVAGLDLTRLKADAAAPEIMTRIATNRDLARKLGITGTPGLVIGEQIQPGMMSLDALKKAVSDARAAK